MTHEPYDVAYLIEENVEVNLTNMYTKIKPLLSLNERRAFQAMLLDTKAGCDLNATLTDAGRRNGFLRRIIMKRKPLSNK